MPPPAAGSSDTRKCAPRGLWKARVASRLPARDGRDRQDSPSNSNFESDIDDNHPSSSSTTSRDLPHGPPVHDHILVDTLDDEVHYFFDQPGHSRTNSPYAKPDWTARTKIINMSSTARGAPMDAEGPTFDRDDWEDLKELFSKATELYQDEPSEALPTLRGVMHECHRFLHCYEDPSTLFLEPLSPESELLLSQARPSDIAVKKRRSPFSSCSLRPWTGYELPTAFHSILGSALYLMGNIIDQDPTLALDGEPDSPIFYWAYALDAFETGETLPSRTRDYEAPEDWSMSMFWGRTYVCLAEETADRLAKAKQSGDAYVSPLAQIASEEPEWPQESPFHIFAARRPTTTRRMSLLDTPPHELMMFAMDQFTRGIFHMPHPQKRAWQKQKPQNQSTASSSSSSSGGSTSAASGPVSGAPSCHPETFSRARELFNVAYDVLLLSDKFENPTERQQWASWADSIFEQMKNEADIDAWRGPINTARGRCWLIFGSAGAVMLEPALERGEVDVLTSEEAEDTRDGLTKAIGFFERAIGSASGEQMNDSEAREIKRMLVESLVTLANCTSDHVKREELYQRAEVEGGADYDLEMYDSDGDQVMED